MTEALSLFGLLSFGWVLATWVAFAGLVAMLGSAGGGRGRRGEAAKVSAPRSWWPALLGLGGVVSAIGIIAVAAPPALPGGNATTQ